MPSAFAEGNLHLSIFTACLDNNGQLYYNMKAALKSQPNKKVTGCGAVGIGAERSQCEMKRGDNVAAVEKIEDSASPMIFSGTASGSALVLGTNEKGKMQLNIGVWRSW